MSLKPGLDGSWLGSFYVITDVIDKESYSNAPFIRPGAARLVIGGARLVGSPHKKSYTQLLSPLFCVLGLPEVEMNVACSSRQWPKKRKAVVFV
jgi:hypothetical protein